MPLIPDEQLEKIRDGIDIVQFVSEFVPLKKAGRNYKGLCPFHSEKTPSFMVSAEKQIFHCFGCAVGGNVIHFLMKFEGIEFLEAVRLLAERTGVAISFSAKGQSASSFRDKKLCARVNRLAAEFFFNQLRDESLGKPVRSYLEGRGIDEATAEKYLLGYAPEGGRSLARHLDSRKVPRELALRVGLIRAGRDGSDYDFFRGRLIFPIRNRQGDFIGFGGRLLEDVAGQPKYINTPESLLFHKGKELYGLYEAREAIRREQSVVLAEGYMDVMALAQNGVEAAVAPLGTALTRDQVKRLRSQVSKMFLAFDADAAGEKAAWRALEVVTAEAMPTRFVTLPAGEDPDSFIRGQGREAFDERLLAAPGLMDYFIDKLVAESPSDNLGRIEVARRLIPQLAHFKGEIEKTLYIQRIASHLGLPEETLMGELAAVEKGGRNFQGQGADDIDAKRHGSSRLGPFERDLLKAVVSTATGAEALRGEIVADDWRDPTLKKLWPQMQCDLEASRGVAAILGDIEDLELRHDLAHALIDDAETAAGGAEEFLRQCRAQLARRHLTSVRQGLTRQIQEAETQSDQKRLEQLILEKNRLLKESQQENCR